jgi:hypothetical protein
VSATHEQIEERAYYLWEERGRPVGSPDVDWACAERELRGEQEADQMASWARPARGRRPRSRPT